jgi:hypothetical protein
MYSNVPTLNFKENGSKPERSKVTSDETTTVKIISSSKLSFRALWNVKSERIIPARIAFQSFRL